METRQPFLRPFNEDDKLVAQVYETTDYDKFHFMSGNRKVDHVRALTKSLKEKIIPNAIIVNEKGEIIDGQNRFCALKQLGKPIWYYIVRGLDIYDVAFLNSYGRNWGHKEYVEMYSLLGFDAYRRIETFYERYKDLGLYNCLIILSLKQSAQTRGETLDHVKRPAGNVEYLKTGRFKIVDIEKSEYIASCILKYKKFHLVGSPIFRHQPFVVTMIKLLKENKFDNDEMVKKATKFPQLFHRCINSKGYTEMLDYLYNYCRKGEKVRLI